MKKLLAIHFIVIFLAVPALWLTCYPYTLRYMEGASFFSNAPDFVAQQVHFPADAFDYCAAFLLQMFRWPWLGACVLAFILWMISACCDIALWCFTKRLSVARFGIVGASAAAAFLPCFPMSGGLLAWCAVAIAAALAALIGGRFIKHKTVPARKPQWIQTAFVSVAVIAIGMAVAGYNTEARDNERLYKLGYLAENKDWDGVLNEVTVDRSRSNPIERRFALLALTATGRLPGLMLPYGISSAEDFVFSDNETVDAQYFNSFFYELLGADNEVIHRMFQINSGSRFGASNRCMRRLFDAFIRQGNIPLADKILTVMSSTTLHGGWVKEKAREIYKAELALREPDGRDGMVPMLPASPTPLITGMANLLDYYPENRIVADVLMCALLASKKVGMFAIVFDRLRGLHYPPGTQLPRVYQEALLLGAGDDPSSVAALRDYDVCADDFASFKEMRDAGDVAGAYIRYPNTYWTYYFGS